MSLGRALLPSFIRQAHASKLWDNTWKFQSLTEGKGGRETWFWTGLMPVYLTIVQQQNLACMSVFLAVSMLIVITFCWGNTKLDAQEAYRLAMPSVFSWMTKIKWQCQKLFLPNSCLVCVFSPIYLPPPVLCFKDALSFPGHLLLTSKYISELFCSRSL